MFTLIENLIPSRTPHPQRWQRDPCSTKGTINPRNREPRVKHLALTFEHTVEFSNNTRASNPPAKASLRLVLAVFRFRAYPIRSRRTKFAPRPYRGLATTLIRCAFAHRIRSASCFTTV